MRIVIVSFVVFVFYVSFPNFCQTNISEKNDVSLSKRYLTYHAELNKRAILSDQGISLEILEKESDEKTLSPEQKKLNYGFITLEYNLFTSENNKKYNVMIAPQDTCDLVYVDYNNNNDFTDDGAPLIFSKKQNELVINVHTSKLDSNCVAPFTVLRKPNMPDSIQKNYVIDNGDCNPKFAKFIGPFNGKFDFAGKAGSFYFVDQNNLRRGKIELNGKSYSIGLYDYTKNGIYNDSTDLMMINLSGGDELNSMDASCVFKLNDVLSVGEDKYKILDCDKYGRWINLIKTDEEKTSYYITDTMYAVAALKTFHSSQIDDSVWQITDTTLFGDKIKLSEYKGNYVLLNFWGEWCAGCVQEIPELVEVNKKYEKKGLKIVSFIQTANKNKAIKMIKDKKIDWPQIELNKVVGRKFKIEGFPINILIMPDGKTCYMTNIITKAALDKYIK